MSHRMKDPKLCSECGKLRERCRAAVADAEGEIMWVCRACWRDLDYDQYLYQHRVAEDLGSRGGAES